MTSLPEALKDVKRKLFESDEQLLMQIAVRAWETYSKKDAASHNSRIEYVRNALGKSLWRQLFDRSDKGLINRQVGLLLTDALDEMQVDEPEPAEKRGTGRSGGGHSAADAHNQVAPSAVKPVHVNAHRRNLPGEFGSLMEPIRNPQKSYKPSDKQRADDQQRAMRGKGTILLRTTPLYLIIIDGKPLANLTVSQVRHKAEEFKNNFVQYRFMLHLTAGIDGNRILGEVWTDPGEVDRLYERARREADAAISAAEAA